MQGSFQLRIDVHDSDIFVDDFVDEVFIEPQRFSPGGSFSTPTQYMGVGRRSQFELSFSVRCRENFYGEDCNTVCVDNEQYSCNADGSRTCNEGFFNLPECLTQCVPAESFTCGPTGNRVCLENYFTESCSVFCRESADQVGGFYTCNPLTGEKECLRGYVDPATNCTMLAPTTCELILQLPFPRMMHVMLLLCVSYWSISPNGSLLLACQLVGRSNTMIIISLERKIEWL